VPLHEAIASKPNGVIAKAYEFAKRAHSGQKRKSGEPYFNHALATGEMLVRWKLDEATVAAGLLHDTVEDTPVTSEDLKKNFGEEVAFLVDGVTKLGRIKYRGAEVQVENLRKLVLTISQDLRVVFIKLADRLHNMRTLDALPPQKQKRIALETSEIYATLAYRLGMHNVAGQLRDLAFPYLHPQEFKWIKENVAERFERRLTYLKKIRPSVEEILRHAGIKPANIDFRAKRYSSLYNKLLRHNMDLDKIYDLVAMRIIVDTVEDCYAALGAIHQNWPPLPGRIKDYIAMPKPNGYRSLHTTVIGPEKRIVEFQIRTNDMHQENEIGIAAHWLYEQSKRRAKQRKTLSPQKLAEEIRWVQQLRNWQEKFRAAGENPEQLLQSMKVDFFQNRIFAMTPRGDVIDLPEGATPVDFAYQIHSEVGDSCVGAKVNRQFVPLDYELHSGDLVEILMQKNKKPSEDWLKFVKTASAREHIKDALKKKRLRANKGPSKTELRVVVKDRVGLLKDITAAIARSHLNIIGMHINHIPGTKFPTNKIELATTDREKMEKLILKLKKIKEIQEISYRLL
jgi:GTP pyrophosphokinase